MIKKLLGPIFFLLLFFYNFSYANDKTDSLLKVLNKHIDEKNDSLICLDYYQLVTNGFFSGETDTIIYFAQKAIEKSRSYGDTLTLINTLNQYARALKERGDFDNAIKKYEEGIRIARGYPDSLLLANCIENLGTCYGSTGKTNYPQAITLLLEAASLKEAQEAWELLPGTYKNISTIFRELGDSLNRETYLLKAVDLVEQGKVSNQTFRAAVFNEAGRFYTDEKPNYEKAIFHYNNVLNISKKINWKKGISVSLTNIANVKELQNKPNEALKIHFEVLELKKGMNDQYGVINTYHSIGTIYQKTKDYSNAVNYLNKGLKLATELNMASQVRDISKNLYTLHRETNNFGKALKYYENYTHLSDSLIGENHKKIVAELETKYETEKKEQKIETLTAEKEIEQLKAQKQQLLAITLGAIIFLIIAIFAIANRQNRLKRQHKEAELNQKLFRSQMNPHFIFNALSSIQNYIYKNEPNEAAKYLANFSGLMRDILESSTTETIPLEQEIRISQNYIELQKMRKNNIFDYTIENTINGEFIVPPMLAQPFIENATIHAFKGVDYKGNIHIRYKTDNNFLIIEVEDNGIGYSPEKNDNSKHKSLAINLTRQRIKYFNTPKHEAVLEIKSSGKREKSGTFVQIKIPIEKCLKF